MMRHHVVWTTLGEIAAIAILLAAPFVVQADVGSFTDDFSSTYNREERTSFVYWDTTKRQISLPQSNGAYAASAAAESRTIANAYGQVFKKATLSVEGDFPAGTRVDYFLTANGSYWEQVGVGQEYTFKNPGNDLRYRVVLFSEKSTVTPTIRKIRIDYVREYSSVDSARTNDNKRLSDAREVIAAIDKFKTERKSYPIVDAVEPKDRWVQLMRLLTDGRFISRSIADPRQPADSQYFYDYLSGNGTSYVVRMLFEDTANNALTTDKDGVFAEIAGTYTCNDPWYCDGQGLTAGVEARPLVPAPFSPLTDAKPGSIIPIPLGSVGQSPGRNVTTMPEPTRAPVAFTLVRDAAGSVWYLANTLGGRQMKIRIPSVNVLRERTNVEVFVQPMANSVLAKIPRARLVKMPGRSEIFFLTGRWQKRWLPTWEIFTSYKDNNIKNVVELDEAIVGIFEDSKLVRLEGDSRVWFIEGRTRREVVNDRAMRRYNLKWEDVSGMNRTEFHYYEEGQPLE